MIACPCSECKCGVAVSRKEAKTHLKVSGFLKGYTQWVAHGEFLYSAQSTSSSNDVSHDVFAVPDNMHNLVHDALGVPQHDSTLSDDSNLRTHQRELLESIVSLFPSEKSAFPVNFLCYLLRAAIFLGASSSCKNELEKRISAILEHVTVDDLLVLSFTYDGERLFDLESVRVAKNVDVYLGEIASFPELGISKINGIAVLVPKEARKIDDDLYRAVDIYLKGINQCFDGEFYTCRAARLSPIEGSERWRKPGNSAERKISSVVSISWYIRVAVYGNENMGLGGWSNQ
ncbi:hypothetical protein ACH5RR_030079 [Cinchona calisaya]|uniref:NPH3 domain-containing protein n=1 Tax=Cinchona calisaya TaxID=153742 RepID=A0ABD2YYT0_9GENT